MKSGGREGGLLVDAYPDGEKGLVGRPGGLGRSGSEVAFPGGDLVRQRLDGRQIGRDELAVDRGATVGQIEELEVLCDVVGRGEVLNPVLSVGRSVACEE